jgi:hypothetical protein
MPDFTDPYAAMATNPYLQPQAPDRLSVIGQMLAGLGAGISSASASGRPWSAGIAPGAAMAMGMIGQGQKQREAEAMKRWQMGMMTDRVRLAEQEQQAKQRLAEESAKRKAAMGDAVMAMLPGGSGVPGFNVQPNPVQMGPGEAIAGIESGGRYDAVGPVANRAGNRAYGKYQVMDFNVGPWTQEVLGKPMTPQEFLANPQAQDAVFKAKFGQYAKQYGGEDAAARAWFAGEGGMNNPNARDVLGTTVADYSRKFNAGRGGPMVAQAGGTIPQGDATGGGLPQIDPRVANMIRTIAIDDPEKAAQLYIQHLQGLKKDDAWYPVGPDDAKMYPGLDPSKAYQRNRVTGEIKQVGGSQVQIDMGGKAVNEIAKQRVQQYEEKIRPTAQAAVGEVTSMHTIRQLLDAGAFTGLGAEQKLLASRVGEFLGLPSEKAANTQALMGAAAERVLAVVKSLGANPSNADRDYLEKAKGGNITFTEAGLRRILDIGERMARDTIKKHGEEVGRIRKLDGIKDMPDEFFAISDAPSYAEWSKGNPLPPVQPVPPTPPTGRRSLREILSGAEENSTPMPAARPPLGSILGAP